MDINRSKNLASPVILYVALLLTGCRTTGVEDFHTQPLPVSVHYTAVSDSITADPVLEKLVSGYRDRLEERVAEVIGNAPETLTKGTPEGVLGNFAADAILSVAREVSGHPVEIAITNNGGLRVPVHAGPITIGDMYELMPFENALVILTLHGVQIDSLAQQIARRNGEPVAGLTFNIRKTNKKAVDIRVQGDPVDPHRQYRVVTSDYLADGGGGIPVLSQYLERRDVGITLRDAFIRDVRTKGTISPMIEGRIVLIE